MKLFVCLLVIVPEIFTFNILPLADLTNSLAGLATWPDRTSWRVCNPSWWLVWKCFIPALSGWNCNSLSLSLCAHACCHFLSILWYCEVLKITPIVSIFMVLIAFLIIICRLYTLVFWLLVEEQISQSGYFLDLWYNSFPILHFSWFFFFLCHCSLWPLSKYICYFFFSLAGGKFGVCSRRNT